MKPGDVDPFPGISLEDLIKEAKQQLKNTENGFSFRVTITGTFGLN